MRSEKDTSSSLVEAMEGKKNMSEGKKHLNKRRKENAEVLRRDNDGKEGGDGIAAAQKSDMEKKKKRKQMDKERHLIKSTETKELLPQKVTGQSPRVPALQLPQKSVQGFHIDIFRDLSSVELLAREAAVEALVKELQKVQKAYEKSGGTIYEDKVQLEAEKDESLKNCAPSLRYALRRLIRGVSSSRECARQGFALGLTAVLGTIQSINTDSILELIDNLLEVSSSMKGQEARDCLLGRLFAYGALARSGRMAHEWSSNNKTSAIKEFIRVVISLADKKSYLREAAASIILGLADTLPVDAVAAHILEAPALEDWFEKAISNENSDALHLALKLREKTSADSKIFCKLLPSPFTPNNLFTPDCLSSLVPCLKETTFCQPRMHSVWPVLVDILFSDVSLQKDGAAFNDSTLALKKCRKLSSTEKTLAKRLSCFCSLVIDGSLLMSSHDRKHLAFDILLLLLPRLPASCSKAVLSYKLIQCLMDILSTKDSWLYKAAQYFLQELSKWAERDVDHLVAVIVTLQQHSFGRFDSITHTHVVKDLVSKINSGSGCMLFVQSLISLFIDEKGSQGSAQATIDSSEMISVDNSSYMDSPGNPDILRSWIVDSLPRVFKYLKLELEEKLLVQKEILKFLTVQGLFTASLGREVTSFELQEKLKWPKTASSSNVRKICIQHLQLLLSDAEKSMVIKNESDVFRTDDLGSYFMHFLDTLCNIPSVSLFRSLSKEDEEAFKKLQSMESRLLKMEEREIDGSKVYAMRFLLIQLLLQVLLKPGEFSETASELVICCKKAFGTLTDLDSTNEEDDDDTGSPAFMDVLVDTFLSLLPQSSAPLFFSIEQVFKFFSDQITESGLISMLRVVKKDLKPSRHQSLTDEEEDDDEDDVLGIEESEDVDQAGDSDGDQSENSSEDEDEDTEESADLDVTANVNTAPLGSDDSDDGMDDEEMFRMDSYLAQIFKDRKNAAGSDTAQSQLLLFKLRVLSLLEIFLHKNAGNPLVLVAYPSLIKTFVNNACATEGNEQLGQRIAGILQKKLFKSKDYPKGDGVQSSLLETQLEKSLKLSSRSRQKVVATLAQNSTFWILKILHGNFSRNELSRVPDMLQSLLNDYFDNKKSRLKPGFIKEIFRRYPWTGHRLFGFLLEKCTSTKSEYRMTEALALIEGILKSWVSGKTHVDEDAPSGLEFLRENLLPLCSLMQQLLSKPISKGSRRSEVRRFFISALQVIARFKLSEAFCKALRPDAYAACESYLGDKFRPLLKFDDGVSGKNITREDKKSC